MITEMIVEEYGVKLLPAVVSYFAVVVAVGLDLVTGLRKAKINGEKIHSTGLKRSCRKMADYILPMMALSMVDLIAISLVDVPVLTMAYATLCVACEVKSIMERSDEKRALRKMLKMAKKSSTLDMIESLLKQMIENENEES